MATQQERMTRALAAAVSYDIRRLMSNQGTLTALTTKDKTSLVNAINELKTAIADTTNINDGSTSKSATWSSDKINASINNAVSALGNDANSAKTIATQVDNSVQVDAPQTFTVAEKAQGCANLGIGNPDTDFTAAYNAAKA